jgi:hypothetical protein
VAITNSAQDDQKFLEERPAAPCLHDHIKVLSLVAAMGRRMSRFKAEVSAR